MLTLTKAVTVGQFCALKLPQSGSILRAQYQKRENDPKAIPSRNLMSIAGLESELIECLSDCLPDVFPLICSIEIVPYADLGIWETQPSNILPGGLGKPLEQILCSHKRQNPLVSFHPFRTLTAVPLFLLPHLCLAVSTHGSTPIHLTGPAKDYRPRRSIPNAWGLHARSSKRAVAFITIRRWSRLQNSFHHDISPG